MVKEMRELGIDILGQAPWGTHLCQFYQTKEDLIEILAPYFKEGLENSKEPRSKLRGFGPTPTALVDQLGLFDS